MKKLDEARANGKADFSKISALLASNITDYQIELDTGVSRAGIGKFRNGKSDPIKMPFYNAIKLTMYAEEKGFK